MKTMEPSVIESKAVTTSQLVNGKRLLEILFAPTDRPCLRWLDGLRKRKEIPFIRLGAFIFYDPQKVRAALESKSATKTARN